MKKKISVLAAVLLAFGLAACGNKAAQATNDTTQTIQAESAKETDASNNPEETQQAVTNEAASNTNDEIVGDISSEVTESPEENGGTLVVYFSATGTTKGPPQSA